jgi:hypothetical protein
MSFFEKSDGSSRFRKTEYLKLTPGTHTIRIIEDSGRKYFQHWMGGSGVKCLGENCPQCKQNEQIVADIGGDPQEAYKKASKDKVEGFSSRQARGAVNVLDRTPIKVCPNCQTENRPSNNVDAVVCSNCATSLVDVEPVVTNRIKVFSRAASVFEDINDLDTAVLDENKEPRGIRNFDVLLHVVGNNTVPVPSNNYDAVEFNEDGLFDLERVVINFSAEEMLQRMGGMSFSEIYKARKTDVYDNADEDAIEAPSKEKVAEIESEVEGMFKG